METLRERSLSDKNARIQYNQILLYVQLLEDNGTRLPENISKHLEKGLWELRPGKNRILYFHVDANKFVLLHQFRKRTQKTPSREILKARKEIKDYLCRKE